MGGEKRELLVTLCQGLYPPARGAASCYLLCISSSSFLGLAQKAGRATGAGVEASPSPFGKSPFPRVRSPHATCSENPAHQPWQMIPAELNVRFGEAWKALFCS